VTFFPVMSVPIPEPGAPYRRVFRGPASATPARAVPRFLRALLLVASPGARAGWLVVALMSALLWTTGARVDWPLLTFDGPYDRVSGEVTFSREHVHHHRGHTSRSFTVGFRYPAGHPEHEGVSSGGNTDLQEGTLVTIEVPRGHDDLAVIAGMQRPQVPYQTFFGFAGVALAALALVGYRARAGRRAMRLLAVGRLGSARLVHRDYSLLHLRKRPVDRLSLDYQDDRGRVHRIVVHTTQLAHSCDMTQPVLYDPAVPGRAVLPGYLPGAPRIDADDRIVLDEAGWPQVLALLPALLAIGLNLTFARFVLFS
jgi:hypothetical protein